MDWLLYNKWGRLALFLTLPHPLLWWLGLPFHLILIACCIAWAYVESEIFLSTAIRSLFHSKNDPVDRTWYQHILRWLYRNLILIPLTFVGLILFFFLFGTSMPASGYLFCCLALIWVLKKLEYKWPSSLISALKPVAIGLGFLSLILLGLNLFEVHDNYQAVTQVEKTILWLDTSLLNILLLDFMNLVYILLALLVVTWFLPQLKLVDKYSHAYKSLWKLSTVIAVLASFSFFTNDAVIIPQSEKISKRLTAIYRAMENEEQRVIAETMALITIETNLNEINDSNKQYHAETLRLISTLHSTDTPARLQLSRFMGKTIKHDNYEDTIKQEYFSNDSKITKKDFSDVDGIRHDAEAIISKKSAHLSRIKEARKQLKIAVVELSNNILFGASEDLKKFISPYIQGIVDEQYKQFLQVANKFIGKTFNRKIFKTSTLISNKADNLLDINLKEHINSLKNIRAHANNRLISMIRKLSIEIPLEISKKIHASIIDIENSDDRTFDEAQHILKQAERSKQLTTDYSGALLELSSDHDTGINNQDAITAKQVKKINALTLNTINKAREMVSGRALSVLWKIIKYVP